MGTPISYPLTSGNRHSPASAELKINDKIVQGWRSIEYTWKLEPVEVRGPHPDPLGFTIGQASYEGSIELYLAEYQQILSDLGPGFAVVQFPITVSYSENGFDTIVDELIGCRFKAGSGTQSGTDPLARKFDLAILKIKPNGVELLQVPLSGTP